jgi:hypothetical protein
MNLIWSAVVDFDGAVLLEHEPRSEPFHLPVTYSLIEDGEWMRELSLPIIEPSLSEKHWRVWNISGFAVFDATEKGETEIAIHQKGIGSVALAMAQYAKIRHRSYRGIASFSAEPLSMVFEDVDTIAHFQTFGVSLNHWGPSPTVLRRLSFTIHCYNHGG